MPLAEPAGLYHKTSSRKSKSDPRPHRPDPRPRSTPRPLLRLALQPLEGARVNRARRSRRFPSAYGPDQSGARVSGRSPRTGMGVGSGRFWRLGGRHRLGDRSRTAAHLDFGGGIAYPSDPLTIAMANPSRVHVPMRKRRRGSGMSSSEEHSKLPSFTTGSSRFWNCTPRTTTVKGKQRFRSWVLLDLAPVRRRWGRYGRRAASSSFRCCLLTARNAIGSSCASLCWNPGSIAFTNAFRRRPPST